MTTVDTIFDLFTISIAAEKAAMNFYRWAVSSFSSVPEVSRFWEGMMRDEALHMKELEEIRSMLSDEQLNRPADQSLAEKAKNALDRFAKLDLNAVVTLDDLYEIAYQLEYSEVNSVSVALLSKYVPLEIKSQFVLSTVREHVSKLEYFSKAIANPEHRRSILARHP